MDVQQQAKAKIDTFPYTKYGTIHVIVTDVSNDAVNDEKKGLIYTATSNLIKPNALKKYQGNNMTAISLLFGTRNDDGCCFIRYQPADFKIQKYIRR